MGVFIGSLGVAIIVVGFIGVLSPDSIMRGVDGLRPTPRLYALSISRLAIGLVLLLGAARTAFPDLIRLGGVVVILRGLAIPVFGPERVRSLMDWLQGRPPLELRVLFSSATVAGGWLVWVALQ